MKKIKNWSFKKHIILSTCITLAALLMQVLGNSLIIRTLLGIITHSNSFSVNDVASIGIIGGADGPTAIFITGNPIVSILIPTVLLFLILLVLYKPLKAIIQRKPNDL